MSSENTPTDNAVAERFMRTFKEHPISGKTFEQATQECYIRIKILQKYSKYLY